MPVNEGQIGMIPGGAYGAPATTDPEVNQGTHAFIGGGGAATFPITLDDGTTTYSITASLGTLTIEVLNDSSLVNSEITLTDTTFLVNGSPKVTSVVAGTNVTVDNTDPLNPIVSSSGSGGGLPALANDKLWVGNGSNVATAVTFTGDVTVANTGVTSLKATGPGASGPFGSATTVPVVTIDANGRVTAFTTATIALPGSAITSGTIGISFLPTGTGASNVPVGGVIAAAGPVGDAAHTPVLTYNAAGQLTTVTSTAIAIPESAVTNLTTDLAAKAFHLVRRAVITAATYTAVAQDLVPVDTTSNSVTVTLPNAPANATFVGVRQIIRGGTNTVTVVCAGSDVFSRASGPTSSVLTLAGQEQIYQYDTATAIWTPVSDCYPLSQLLSSPAFTGVPTAPTGTAGDSSTQIATDAFVTTAINNAIAAVNPAVAVQAATAAILPNSPTYSNGVAGVGATLTTVTTNTALVVDGVTPTLNQRILVKNQASAFQNGVYVLSTIASLGVAWILTRALDYDQPSDINNTGAIPVVAGTVNTNTSWLLTSTVATIGTDALTYTQFSLNPNVALPVANGGTGLATLTAHGVLLGEGTGNVSAVAPNATSTFALFSTGASTDPAYRAIAESDVVNLTTDLTAVQTQAALQQAYLAARTQMDLGYYAYGVNQLFLSPNATPTKLDMTAGTMFTGNAGSELNIAAQTAISTTIASLADATNPKWVVVEIDSGGTIHFNQGTAAASPAFPVFTSNRLPNGFLFVPANATNVDTALTSVNGNAKLILLPFIKVEHHPRQLYTDTAGTVVTNQTTALPTAGATLLSAAPTLPANSLNVGDIIKWHASGNMLIHTTSVVTFNTYIGASTNTPMAMALGSITLDTTNSRTWFFDTEMICIANGATTNFKISSRFAYSAAQAGATGAEAVNITQTVTTLIGGTVDNTGNLILDLQVRNTTSDAATKFTLHELSIIKAPA